LASPLSAGLFHAAIIESGTCNDDNFFVSYSLSRNWTNTYT
jgi:carboxylesterase type B